MPPPQDGDRIGKISTIDANASPRATKNRRVTNGGGADEKKRERFPQTEGEKV